MKFGSKMPIHSLGLDGQNPLGDHCGLQRIRGGGNSVGHVAGCESLMDREICRSL